MCIEEISQIDRRRASADEQKAADTAGKSMY